MSIVSKINYLTLFLTTGELVLNLTFVRKSEVRFYET